jgi:diacylglycerol kinase family enzyme
VNAGADATIQLPEDSVALDATVTDDGLPSNTLTYTWSVSSGPAGATFTDASAEDTTVTFVDAGTYVLELTASDSALQGSDTVQVTVEPAVVVNNPPTANAQSVSTAEDTALPITLTGTDPDGDTLTFAIGTGPTSGTLSGTAPNVTYTPNAGFNGADSFTFTVNDGAVDSAAATVSISVGAVNDAPTADAQSVSTDEDTALPITLTGSDPDGDALTFAIATQPTNGTLSGTAPAVTYTPNAEFNGADSFTFTVNDGTVDSAEATVSITVNAVNDAPTADDQSVTTNQAVALEITMTGSDTDGDALTFAIGTAPTNGTLSGELDGDELVTYTPNGGFTGSDSFTFTVNDGTVDSAEATVSITVCAACAYWQFDTGAGTTAFDTWGDTDGTIVDSAAPSWTDGVTGPGGTDFALDFDGSGDHVDMVDATALDITGTSLTLTAWIYPRDGGANGGSRVISKMNNASSGDVYAMYTDQFRLRFRTAHHRTQRVGPRRDGLRRY